MSHDDELDDDFVAVSTELQPFVVSSELLSFANDGRLVKFILAIHKIARSMSAANKAFCISTWTMHIHESAAMFPIGLIVLPLRFYGYRRVDQ